MKLKERKSEEEKKDLLVRENTWKKNIREKGKLRKGKHVKYRPGKKRGKCHCWKNYVKKRVD